jgi:hypothetical protein
VATVARDLDPVVEDFRAVMDLGEAYSDPGVGEFGLHNAVLPIGDTFLEIVSPKEPGTTAGRYLDKVGDAAGYMVILQTDEDMDSFRDRMSELGVRTVWKADYPDIRGTHLHPKDVGGAILSVDQAIPPESWRWAGPDWQQNVRTEVVERIVGAELSSEMPAGMARRWAAIVGVEAQAGEHDSYVVELEGGRLLFRAATDGRVGVTGVEVDSRGAERVMTAAFERRLDCSGGRVRIGGVDFRFIV